MKLLALVLPTALAVPSLHLMTQEKTQAKQMLSTRQKRGLFSETSDFARNQVFDTIWESAKDQIEENKNIYESEDIEQLKECTAEYNEAHDTWKEDINEWQEDFLTNPNPQPAPGWPVYNCMIGGKTINLIDYTMETF